MFEEDATVRRKDWEGRNWGVDTEQQRDASVADSYPGTMPQLTNSGRFLPLQNALDARHLSRLTGKGITMKSPLFSPVLSEL